MSFLDRLAKGAERLLGKGQCALGFHKGEWDYLRPDRCEQEVNCARCGLQTRVKHESYTSWEEDAQDACREIRHCERCAEEDARSNHDFVDQGPKRPGDCRTFTQACRKCREKKEKRYSKPKHRWGSWQANPGATNEMFRVCNHCGEKEFDAIKESK